MFSILLHGSKFIANIDIIYDTLIDYIVLRLKSLDIFQSSLVVDYRNELDKAEDNRSYENNLER